SSSIVLARSLSVIRLLSFFFFTHSATTEIYTLSLHDALPIYVTELFNQLGITISIDENLMDAATVLGACGIAYALRFIRAATQGDRKSTRLNSSHVKISYAVFCLKKKKKTQQHMQ